MPRSEIIAHHGVMSLTSLIPALLVR
jgi:hypothetical protein